MNTCREDSMDQTTLHDDNEIDPDGWFAFEEPSAHGQPVATGETTESPPLATSIAPKRTATPSLDRGAPPSPPASTPPSIAKPRKSYGRSKPQATGGSATLLPHLNHLDMFPAFMSRSELFGAFRPNAGGTHNGPLEAAGAVELTFEGPRLSMADKRVWKALVQIAKRQRVDIGEPFEARLSEVAILAGYVAGQSRSAYAAIERLAGARLDAKVEGARVSGWMLMSSSRKGRFATVRFDPSLAAPALGKTLLASNKGAIGDGLTSLLAQWLRDYFSTHEPSNKPFTLGYLQRLSGYVSKAKHFVPSLEKAMAELASLRPDLVASWSIDRNAGMGPTSLADHASDRWWLLVERGPARPSVKHPPKAAPAPTQKRRGGVSL
jgi:hypothetical protein